jgi:hypothetical protein
MSPDLMPPGVVTPNTTAPRQQFGNLQYKGGIRSLHKRTNERIGQPD